MKKEKISLIYKLLIVIVSAVGLILNLRIAPPGKMILYFTILSNLMCLVFYLVVIVLKLCNKLKKERLYYVLKGMVTMCIVLTMLVYNIALKETAIYIGHELECNMVHLVTPILVILDYFIFEEKGKTKFKDIFIWCIPLLIYLLFIEVYSKLGGTFLDGAKFPYGFLDNTQIGYLKSIINCCGLLFIYTIFGCLIHLLDNRLKKVK